MICSAEDLFTLNSNKFIMVYKVDGNPQLDSRDWSMYSNHPYLPATRNTICEISPKKKLLLMSNLDQYLIECKPQLHLGALSYNWAQSD